MCPGSRDTPSFISVPDYGSRFFVDWPEQPADRRIVKLATTIITFSKTDLAYQGNLRDDGYWSEFDRALPELETYLESQVADGEGSETRLTYNGLCYLKQLFAE